MIAILIAFIKSREDFQDLPEVFGNSPNKHSTLAPETPLSLLTRTEKSFLSGLMKTCSGVFPGEWSYKLLSA